MKFCNSSARIPRTTLDPPSSASKHGEQAPAGELSRHGERLCGSAPWGQVCFTEFSCPTSEHSARHRAGAQGMSKWMTRSSFLATSVLPSVRMQEEPSCFDFLKHSSRHRGEERAFLSWAGLCLPWIPMLQDLNAHSGPGPVKIQPDA